VPTLASLLISVCSWVCLVFSKSKITNRNGIHETIVDNSNIDELNPQIPINEEPGNSDNTTTHNDDKRRLPFAMPHEKEIILRRVKAGAVGVGGWAEALDHCFGLSFGFAFRQEAVGEGVGDLAQAVLRGLGEELRSGARLCSTE